MSLKEMAPPTAKIGGISVYGISLSGVVMLANRFPELARLFGGKSEEEIDIKTAIMRSPPIVAAFIAAGTGDAGDEDCEKVASLLNLEMQVDFVEAIIKATVPGGVGPFAERLTRYAEGALEKQVAISSPNSGKDSTSSSPQTIPKPMSGASRQNNSALISASQAADENACLQSNVN